MEICRNNNLYICNGRVKGDEIGALMCVKGSVIDYLISTIEGILFVNNFVVHNYSPLFSDVHCAISFKITACQHKTDDKAIAFKQKQWEKSKKGHYTPPLKCGEVLCYTLRCLSVRPSVRAHHFRSIT